MTIWYKCGVFGELRPEAAEGLRKTEKLYNDYGEDVYITSVRDGAHGPGSFHPHGKAWDMRKGIVPLSMHKMKLGKDFDVIDESNHRHIEYDPK